MRPLLLLACAAGLAAATATAWDGRVVEGELSGGTPSGLTIGGNAVALADIDRLVLASGPAPSVTATLGLLLADGSWLPATAIAAADKPDRLRVDGPLGALEIPLEAVSGWGDPSPPAALASGDAVLVEAGLLPGRVEGLRDGVLRFRSQLDPEPLALPVAEVRGLRLAAAVAKPAGGRLRLRLAPGQPPLDLVPAGDGVALAAAPTVRLPAERLGGAELRVEGLRRAYLSDLAPATVEEPGMFGVVWPHARDGAIGGGPLLLAGSLHQKGLTAHAPSRLAWRLDRAYVRLRAQAGIADQVAPEGDCVAVLLGDGRELWRARLRQGEAPRRLDLDLAGVAVLELRLEAGERHDIGDHAVFADAQLIRR
jgi:hypothetical protein